jgi:RNA polymerase sigma factor (sigma-70 family)
MGSAQVRVALDHVRRLAAGGHTPQVADRQLLERFSARREEGAFAALVRRHGPMVLGVCRRVLNDFHAAEDAFQATFLVLAKKAGSLHQKDSLSGWLYGVAYRLAVRTRVDAARRQRREACAGARAPADPVAEVSERDLCAAIDAELQRLSEPYRMPLVLCYLEGQTRDEAARALGCSLSTLKRRLDVGRERLRARLARRGLSLSGALLAAALPQAARAAVPAGLARAATQAALLSAAGQSPAAAVSAQAAALAGGALRTMSLTRLVLIPAVLVLVGALGMAVLARPAGTGNRAEGGAPQAVPPPAVDPQEKQAGAPARAGDRAGEKEQPAPATKQTMTVTGRVLAADGKPVADARVAVLAHPRPSTPTEDAPPAAKLRLGLTQTEADGRFSLQVRRTASAREHSVVVIASAPGHGLGWHHLHPDAARPQAAIRLHAEQVVRGRLLDLQGAPAAGVKLYLAYVAPKGAREEKDTIGLNEPYESLAPWPGPVTTDRQGRFTLRGVGRDQRIGLHVRDERFARQTLQRIETGNPGKSREASLLLQPPQVVEGRVTQADTGRPVPHARLIVIGQDRKFGESTFQHGTVTARADAQGRFRVSSFPGNTVAVKVFPPEGTPYLAISKDVAWPRGAARQPLDVALPRGVLVRGRVTEAGSGRPVAGAAITFWPQRADNPHFREDVNLGLWGGVSSGPDGSFRMAVLPGPGHLIAQAATPDFLQRKVHYDSYSGRITDAPDPAGKGMPPSGGPWFVNGLAALDLKPKAEPAEVKVTFRRGVTVTGRLAGPDGKPAAEVRMVCRLPVASLGYGQLYPAVVRDGRFELPGCDPGKTYPVYFLDIANRRGAVVHVSGQQAGKAPVRVSLAPCGTAVVRFVDAGGNSLPHFPLGFRAVQLVVRPGAAEGKKVGGPEEVETVSLDAMDPRHHAAQMTTDAQGRITLPALIPGATYRIAVGGRTREFTVGAGKTVALPDFPVGR